MTSLKERLAALRNHGRIAEIEVLRGLAVIGVLIEHAPLNLVFWHSRLVDFEQRYARFWVGVDLFFAISGFVIARSLLPVLDAGGWLEAVRFWIRRAWRLLPSAWLWLAIPLALTLAFNRSGAFGPFRASYEAAVAAVLEVANFHLAGTFGRAPSGVSFPYWSLSLEEQFYWVLPIAALLLRARIIWAVALVAAMQVWAPHTPLAMVTRSGAIALGVLLAIWSGRPSWQAMAPLGLAKSRGARCAVLGGTVLLLGALGSDELQIASFRLALIALLCAALVWLASYDSSLLCRPGALRRTMAWIGARSYAIYLIHVPVYFAAHELWFRLHGATPPRAAAAWLYAAAAVAAILLLSDANWRWIETPLRRRGAAIAAGFAR